MGCASSAEEGVTVEELAKQVRTGDLLLFDSKNNKLRAGGLSRWTHVALVVVTDEGVPYVFEVVSHKWVPGPREAGGAQLVDMVEKINMYVHGGACAWRRLTNVASKAEENQLRDLFMEFLDEIKDRPYQKAMDELIRAGIELPGFDPKEETLEDLFCSEAVAEAMVRMGILAKDKPSNNYVPGDFSTATRPGDKIAPIAPYDYTAEIHVLREEVKSEIDAFYARRDQAHAEWAQNNL